MYIEQVSQGRYLCVLPQDLEQATERAVDIRNQDLKQVVTCDLGLFNFDGTELDSGTVAHKDSPESNRPEKLWNLMRERGVPAVTIPHHTADRQHPMDWLPLGQRRPTKPYLPAFFLPRQ